MRSLVRIYGLDGIPEDWIEALRGKDVIDRCLGETEEEAATLTREERHALERWTGGIASVNRALRGESPYPKKDRIALKSSWDIKHMPRHKHTTIGIGIELSEEELIELAKGHIPEEMEDHWFMYFDGEYIRYYPQLDRDLHLQGPCDEEGWLSRHRQPRSSIAILSNTAR